VSDNLPDERPGADPDSLAVGILAALQMAATGLGYIDPAVAVLMSGAVAGAGAWTPTLAQGLRRRLHNAAIVERVARRISRRTDEELAEAAASTPAKQQVTAEVFEAAIRTALDEKIVALGRALATALLAETDVEVEGQRKLVAALARLEAPDVQVLGVVSGDHAQSKHADGRDRVFASGWTLDLVGLELPALVDLVHPLVAGLVGAGLVVERGSAPGDLAAVPGYQITGFGRLVLDSLPAAGADLDGLESEGQMYPPDL
jgi:hypothetical protein